MALVLSMKRGDGFWVGGKRIELEEIEDEKLFWLRVDGKRLRITDQEAREVVPDVLVSSGGYYSCGMVRIAITAPRSIEILRDERYMAKYGDIRKIA